MKLSGQLLLVTAVVATLPLIGVQFVRQLETLLREGHEQALIDSARALATRIEAPPVPLAVSEPLYLHRAGSAPFLDGYGDDWDGWLDMVDAFAAQRRSQRPAPFAPDPDWPLTLAAARADAALFLLFRMRDSQVLFARSAERPGDRVELLLEHAGRSERIEIAPAAPGRFTQPGVDSGVSVQGDWQVHAHGWNLELKLPDGDRFDALAFRVFDRDAPDGPEQVTGSGGALPLIGRDPRLDQRLARAVAPGDRAWIVDWHGYVLGQAGALQPVGRHGVEAVGFWQALLFQRLTGSRDALAEPLAARAARLSGPDLVAARAGGSAFHWQVLGGDTGAGVRVRVALPLTGSTDRPALLVVERDADALMILASDAVVRLIGFSLLGFAGAALVLLLFAWRLTRRIRRLERGALAAVAEDGRVAGSFTPMAGDDELAGLSRTVARLLDRLRVHQDYLRTLADKLAHELRTPLATIRSSLDNLEAGLEPEDPARRWLDRAGHGSRRLERVLRAMSEAARLEDALIDEPFERFDLAALVDQYLRALRSTRPDGPAIELRLLPQSSPQSSPQSPTAPFSIAGSPDLVAQLLDKLLENALDFTPRDGRIRVSVERAAEYVRLVVDNDGPPIDAARAAQLFEPMVSHRAGHAADDDRLHLGLGLFIARLIVERHGGSIRARPRPGGSRFEVDVPAASSRHA